MRYSKIVLAGGNGYLGTMLASHFSRITDEIIILSRKSGYPFLFSSISPAIHDILSIKN